MKFVALVSCVFVAAFIGHTLAQEYRRPAQPNRYRHRRPHGRFDRNPCGSNDLGDYRGGCDISVPVIVMPKGRPIMERVLDWFNCGTEWCRPSEPETPPTTTYEPEPTTPPEEEPEPPLYSPTTPPEEDPKPPSYSPTTPPDEVPEPPSYSPTTSADNKPPDTPYWN